MARHPRCKFAIGWEQLPSREPTRCVARHSRCPYSVWSLGNFHCRIIGARQRESMPNRVRRDCQRSITRPYLLVELKLKLERNPGCCFTTTKVGKPSSSLCPEAAYRPVQKGPKGPMVPLGEAPDDEGSQRKETGSPALGRLARAGLDNVCTFGLYSILRNQFS